MKNKNMGPSGRQLKVGENLRKAISYMLQNHSFHNPIIDKVSILILLRLLASVVRCPRLESGIGKFFLISILI